MSVRDILEQLTKHAWDLPAFEETLRNKAIWHFAHIIDKEREQLIAANKKDYKNAREAEVAEALIMRLILNDEKIQRMINSLHAVAAQETLVGSLLSERELRSGLLLQKLRCPIGLIAFIFESRPDAFVQMVSLAIKSANALILKGGSEALHSNQCLYQFVQRALSEAGLPPCIGHITEREDVKELLRHDDLVSLLIPRGSKNFVHYLMHNTRIPILGHADGICHIYVDKDADIEQAIAVVVDSKTQYPAVCNAVETLLVHKDASEILQRIVVALKEKGVCLKVDKRAKKFVSTAQDADEDDWRTEYLDLILSIKMVEDVNDAVRHINKYGSHHTDAIITKNKKHMRYFLARINSANAFANCSTRLSDGYRYGLGAESGISTGKLHARGPVGIEGLMTYRWVLIGQGHTVAEYDKT